MAEQYAISIDGKVIGEFESMAEVRACCDGYYAAWKMAGRPSELSELTLYLLRSPPEMYRVIDGQVVATGSDAEKIS